MIITVWLNRVAAHDNSFSISTRYICVLDACENQTIGDLKAKIVEQLSMSTDPVMNINDDIRMFFRGTRFPDETILANVRAGGCALGDDSIFHACSEVLSDPVKVASKQSSPWFNFQ